MCKMIFDLLLGIYPVYLWFFLSQGQRSIPKSIWWNLKTQLLVVTTQSGIVPAPPAR